MVFLLFLLGFCDFLLLFVGCDFLLFFGGFFVIFCCFLGVFL